WLLLAGRAIAGVPSLVTRLRAQGRARIGWNPNAAWTARGIEEVLAHLAYMAVDMPDTERHGLTKDALLETYAVTGDRRAVVERLRALREAVRPALLLFDAHSYSTAFMEEVAGVALDCGALALQNGLD